MTVSSTLSQQQFACDGTSRVFVCPFRVLESSELVGYLITVATNAQTLLTNGVDFTVSGVGDANAIATTVATYASTYRLKFSRSTSFFQPTDYRDNDPFPAESHEQGMDRLTHIAQELEAQQNRALLFPSPETGQTLPVVTGRANRFPVFNADGDIEASSFTQSQVAAAIDAAGTSTVPGAHILGAVTQTVAGGVTVVTIAGLTYAPGVNALLAVADGILLTAAAGDFTEDSATQITLAEPFVEDTDVTFLIGRLVTSGVDDEQVATVASGAGTVGRSQHDRNEDVFSVFECMTTAEKADVRNRGDAVDVSAAMLAAATRVSLAGGGRVYLPAGQYRLDDSVDVAFEGVTFVGADRIGTMIRQHDLGSPIFNFTRKYFGVQDVGFQYAGTPIAGADVIRITGSNCGFGVLRGIWIWSSYRGVTISGGPTSIHMTDLTMYDYESAGVYAQECNEIFLSKFVFNASNTTRGTSGGLCLKDFVEAFVASDGSIINGVYSMGMDASSYTVRDRPASNKFSNVLFDSSDKGVYLNNSVNLDFMGCWFSNSNQHNLDIGQVDGARFIGGSTISSRQHGAYVNNLSKRIVFCGGFSARENSVASPGIYSGIYIEPDTTDFMVTGCVLGGPAQYSATLYQQHGLVVDTGTSDRYLVADNLVSGNLSTGVTDGGSGSNKTVARNY